MPSLRAKLDPFYTAVEGAIKQVIGKRMKPTGARWRPEHVGPLVELVALVDSPDWHDIWTAA